MKTPETLAALTALILLAAACDSGGGDDSADTSTTTGPVGEPTEVIERREPVDCTPETTTGCVTVNDGAPAESRYTVFNNMSPDNTGAVLIDGNGEIINTWVTNGHDSVPQPEPGTLLAGLEHPGQISIPRIIAFSTPCLIIMNWDGETIWPEPAEAGAECGNGIDPIPFETDESGEPTANAHHDLQVAGTPVTPVPGVTESEGDGRVLYLSHRFLSPEESLRVTSNGEINDDRLVEIAEDGDDVLWEWSAAEHIDQLGFDDDALAAIDQFTGGDASGVIPQAIGDGDGPPRPSDGCSPTPRRISGPTGTARIPTRRGATSGSIPTTSSSAHVRRRSCSSSPATTIPMASGKKATSSGHWGPTSPMFPTGRSAANTTST